MFADRNNLIARLPNCKKIVEVGVFKAEFSEFIYQSLKPEELVLIDSWSAEPFKKYFEQIDADLSFKKPSSYFASYFGGDPTQQDLWDKIFKEVSDKFIQRKNVKILRKESHSAAKHFENGYFDMVYIDANHQYSLVQRDLDFWKDKIKDDGFLILNDCCACKADVVRGQNLGVLEVVTNFVKHHNFKPLVLISPLWSDLILVKNPYSPRVIEFYNRLIQSKLSTIELPDEVLFSYQHKIEGNVLVPSFKL